MASRGFARWPTFVFAPLAACLMLYFFPHGLLHHSPAEPPAVDPTLPRFQATETSSAICIALAKALPDSVYSEHYPTFNSSLTDGYWSLPATQLKPSCIVKPFNAEEVSTAVRVLKSTHESSDTVRFAVRSGGHSPEAGFASIDGGVLIELSLLNEVTLPDEGAQETVIVGAGARWHDVSSKLDNQNRAIVGGRNSKVGVGGLILGGGISFFSPRWGLVCDNIDSYEIVLANGTIAQVSAESHPDLWRALKGGSGNVGIVTRITARTFPVEKEGVWAGYLYWPNFVASKVLTAFHDINKPENFDEYAAGPILAFSYVQAVGLKPVVCNIVYTKPEPWPKVFKPFKEVSWRVWNTIKVQSLSTATEELNGMAPYGLRQFQVTTTIKNDLETFEAFREAFDKKLEEVKGIKNGIWSLVYQPLSAATRKSNSNTMGLNRDLDETLIIVLICVSWTDAKDDELVHNISREMIALGETYAERKGTADPYRYLNYAASGQNPFRGYGEENLRFLKEVSRKYDPDGFWQKVKEGGFKLGMD